MTNDTIWDCTKNVIDQIISTGLVTGPDVYRFDNTDMIMLREYEPHYTGRFVKIHLKTLIVKGRDMTASVKIEIPHKE